MKVGFITGITGQDGSYLAELLLEKGYNVFGLIRRSSNFNTQRIQHIFEKINLRYGDLCDIISIVNILNEIKLLEPTVIEFYNLAAQSHVKVSFEMPVFTSQVNSIGTLNCLEAIRQTQLIDKVRFYQASTSELYGEVLDTQQSEKTKFNPVSPYAVSKLFAYYMVKNYKESYKMFCCNGILFNHESPRRGGTFVTKKIIDGIKKIINAEQEYISLGNINSKRDWGHAKDYVKAMWLILQRDEPKDYVVSSNTTISVREFIEKSFKNKNIEILWEGEGLNEVGKNKENGKVLIKISEKYFRPCEVENLYGDSSILREELGWEPEYNIDTLIDDMFNNFC
uniref:GDP-mannose 4,6-dehydratase n=1 Tax=viral metagenome TaxID=1070528 RepID=A0A6C0J8H3_9ZZZZ